MDGQRILVSKYGNNDLLVRPLFRYDPKAVTGSFSHLGQGHPTNPWLVGPRCTVLYRGVGARHAIRGSPRRHTPHPTNPNPTRGSTRAAGSSAAAAEDFLLDPTYTVPPPDTRSHRSRHCRPRAATAAPASSRGRPCDHNLRDGVRLHTFVQPRWSASLHSLLFF
jgi:hypothetical protein